MLKDNSFRLYPHFQKTHGSILDHSLQLDEKNEIKPDCYPAQKARHQHALKKILKASPLNRNTGPHPI